MEDGGGMVVGRCCTVREGEGGRELTLTCRMMMSHVSDDDGVVQGALCV